MKTAAMQRAMSVVLCLVLVGLLCLPCAAQEQSVLSPWAVEEVAQAWETGIVPADLDLGEDYTAPISRGAFARLAVETAALCRGTDTAELLAEYGLEAESVAEESPFADTADPYVVLAARMGLVQGSNWGNYNPDGILSRAQAAVMLHRLLALMGRSEANAPPMWFSDGYSIPAWARESVKFISGRTTAQGKAVMGGVWGRFDPNGVYSVEQAVISLDRCRQSAEVEGIYDAWRDAPGYDTVALKLSFGGDCTFGRNAGAAYAGSFDAMYDKMGPAYFFSNVKEFHSDDLTMVNLEGALTTSNQPRENKEFVFKGRPEYAAILKEGSVDVVTIANNHARDYGTRGLEDTVRALSPHVAVSGYARQPIVTVKGVKIGFASNLGWSFDASQKKFITDAIADLRAQGAQIIVFNYHWGEERQYKSNATQRAIAHYCIDSGADLVIGHHPHVVQEVETYREKQIVYSLGNLSFGGNRNPTDKNCLIYQAAFTVNVDTGAVVSSGGTALPYRVSSVDTYNDYRPTPVKNDSK